MLSNLFLLFVRTIYGVLSKDLRSFVNAFVNRQFPIEHAKVSSGLYRQTYYMKYIYFSSNNAIQFCNMRIEIFIKYRQHFR